LALIAPSPLADIILWYFPLTIVSDGTILQTRWWPLLKIEMSLIVYRCFIIRQNELTF
jgi:hypothetical protein